MKEQGPKPKELKLLKWVSEVTGGIVYKNEEVDLQYVGVPGEAENSLQQPEEKWCSRNTQFNISVSYRDTLLNTYFSRAG